MQTKLSETIGEMVGKIRAHTSLPIAVGFGISTPDQARQAAASADAIVVGSAIVNQIAAHGSNADLTAQIKAFTLPLASAVKEKLS